VLIHGHVICVWGVASALGTLATPFSPKNRDMKSGYMYRFDPTNAV